MTQEEKAKAYDEALERARVMYDVNYTDSYTKANLETIFPELRESEDERMRKRAIAILKYQRDYWSYDGPMEKSPPATPRKDLVDAIDVALSELEKQKERGHLTKDEEYTLHRIIEYLEDETCPSEWISLLHDIYCLPYAKQKEQKPLRNLEIPAENESVVETADSELEKELNAFLCGYDREINEEEIATLTNVAEHFYQLGKQEQKPVKDVIKEITKDKDSAMKFLKSAGIMNDNGELAEMYRSEQKPVEWNNEYREEDLQTRFAFYTYKDDPSVLYLSNVFVEESSRNHGFGTRILKAAEKVAEAVGATTISLKVKQDSPANAWYRKRGYGYVAFEDGYDWLEKNLEYMKPNKAVEWSEEDEQFLLICKNALHKYQRTDQWDANIISKWLEERLKSIFSQPKQEWSEEDERILKRLIRDYEEAIKCSGNVWGERFQENLAWLKSLRPIVNANSEKVNVNWSEEDEEIFNNIIEKAKGGHWIEVNEITWLINRFKLLRSQPKQEWSEKDKRILQSLHHIMNCADAQNTVKRDGLSVEDVCTFLFSVQPSWKPSEEQMDALIRCIAPLEHKYYCILSELYEQLKKLM